jgi:GntR family transcriptional regulator, rspAB operon transcriptional repressor
MKMEARPYQFLEPAVSPTRGNVTAYVTDSLREAIVTLALRPGEALDKGALCERFGVSRFPVSEALARLQAEGLVDILPQRGSTVSLVRIADVLEYMLIRKALESEAVRVLLGSRDEDLIDALGRSISYQKAAAEIDDRQGFHALDLEFHDMLFTSMRFAKIKGVIESARSNLDRARRLIITPRRLAYTLAEHQAILDGIISGDADIAAKAMRRHIDSVMSELLEFARATPSLFADGHLLSSEAGYDNFPFG